MGVTTPQPTAGELCEAVDAALTEEGPRDAAGVVRVRVGGAVLLERAWGVVDRRWQRPLTLDDRLPMASGSKGFTALAVLSLVADGTLTLATTARSLLGDDLPAVPEDVTVEHLLTHTSGLADAIDDDADEDAYLLDVPVHSLVSPEDYLGVLEACVPQRPPGPPLEYRNAAFVLLSLLAQRASGVRFHDLVRERVLRPAGMTRTDFLRSDELPPDAAVGYVRVGDAWRSHVLHLPVVGGGDGGAYTTAADMERFWDALLAGRVVPPALVAEATTPHATTADGAYAYGLGLWLPPWAPGVVQLEGEDAGVSFWSAHRAAVPGGAPEVTATVAGTTAGAAWPVERAVRTVLGMRGV
ncbi:serine hydrolase domain-containing protein [Cellulomonas fimi]|uniref:serine hydrolase domain-containing protein n=1 Tax=Cellulomonas fimi TaxID=1708 RepID=UPI0002F01AE6|nr:serine hydrolase domain-containing protein [Cellulomonas fimi]